MIAPRLSRRIAAGAGVVATSAVAAALVLAAPPTVVGTPPSPPRSSMTPPNRPPNVPRRPAAPGDHPAAEQTCGQELAASAEVPRTWGELMEHVAGNMEWHARWVGTGTPAARREHDAMLRVVAAYRAMARAAAQADAAMTAMKDLPPAPHDRAKIDRTAQARYMRTKIDMQRAFSALLLRHAEESEQALAELEPPAPR